MHRRDFFRTAGAGAAALGMAAGGRATAAPRALDGPWRVRIDAADKGKAGQWFRREPADSVARAIPARAGAVLQEFTDFPGGIAWYFTEFDVPAGMRGSTLRLRFHAVNYFAEVWVNGNAAGSHEGGFTPFDVDITAHARTGANRLAVRVVDPPRPFMRDRFGLAGWSHQSDGRAGGFDFMEIPMGPQYSREGFKISGIWQPVELLAAPQVHVSDVFLEARLSGEVTAHIQIVNAGEGAVSGKVTASVCPFAGGAEAGGAEQAVRLQPGANRVDLPLSIRSPHPWSPDDPFLYAARIALEPGGHEVSERFGLREFVVRGPHFYLNGKRLYLKGAHYQGTYPGGLFNPPDREFAFRDIRLIKELGFNYMRLWVRPEAPALLDAADELGILLQEEPPLLRMEDSPLMSERSLREVREVIRRDKNRPSIVIWNMINERAPGMKVVREMCLEARRLDPTRLVTETAGGQSHYFLPYSSTPVPYLTEHSYPGAPMTEATVDYWQNRGTGDVLYINTEYGFGGADDAAAVVARYGPNPKKHMEDYQGYVRLAEERGRLFENSAFRPLFGTLDKYRAAAEELQADCIRVHTDVMRGNPGMGGYNIVQCIDSNALEVDGLVDFWRERRKKAAEVMREINRPLLLVLRAAPMNVRPGEETALRIALANEDVISGAKRLRVRVTDATGREAFARELTVETGAPVSVLFDDKVRAPETPGRCTIHAELLDGDRSLATRSDFFTVFAPAANWPAFALLDPERQLDGFLRERGIAHERFTGTVARPTLIVLTRFAALWRRPEEFRAFLGLTNQVERGAVALFLGAPSDGRPPVFVNNHSMLSPVAINNILPFSVGSRPERWGQRIGPYSFALEDPLAGIPVPDHPIYEGLPHTGLMGREYGNVAPSDMLMSDRDPEETVGPSVQVYGHGRGRIAFTTLDFSQVRRDALAERLLRNLLAYAAGKLPAELAPENPDSRRTLEFRLSQYQDCLEKVLRPGSA